MKQNYECTGIKRSEVEKLEKERLKLIVTYK